MESRVSWAIQGPVLTYLGVSFYGIALELAVPMGITERAPRKLVVDLESVAQGKHAEKEEGFYAGLDDGDFVLFGPSIEDREALLPYIGILCGGDSL